MVRPRASSRKAGSMIIELVCVGDELLSGITLNTNAHWLSCEIASLGASVSRVTTIGDSIQLIGRVLSESLARKPDMIIVTGGLGATYDDLTLEGLAAALGVKTQLDRSAVKMLKRSYSRRGLHYTLDPVRLKMATIPAGSTPVQNPVGSAPAVSVKSGRTQIYCLQGVPGEMEAIFTKCISPVIKKHVGPFVVREENYEVEGVSEAMLSPALTRIVSSVPRRELYLKTHPHGYAGTTPRLRIQIVCRGTDARAIAKRLGDISSMLLAQVAELGGRVIVLNQ